MKFNKTILWPISTGLAGMFFQFVIYFGFVSWVESPQHALDLIWQDIWLILPLFFGFGIQVALFTILKKRLFVPSLKSNHTTTATLTGAGGTSSTLAMIACCAHHVTDVLPILGLTAAASFLAKYQTTLMLAALFIPFDIRWNSGAK